MPSKYTVLDHYQPPRKMPFKWCFACQPLPAVWSLIYITCSAWSDYLLLYAYMYLYHHSLRHTSYSAVNARLFLLSSSISIIISYYLNKYYDNMFCMRVKLYFEYACPIILWNWISGFDIHYYQLPLILTVLLPLPGKHGLSHGMCLYQVMMTLHILNDVANDAESTRKSNITS